MTARTILFWLDLEATSLDVRKGFGELLEYAVVFTDLELNELWCDEGVIPHKMDRVEALLGEKARAMHEKNGLLDELRSNQGDDAPWCFGEDAVRAVEDHILRMLKQFQDGNTIFVLTGSSIGYDRIALKEHMPKLERMLHYRQLDTSVYKVGFPQLFGSETSVAHRAMADIRESIKKHALMRKIISDRKELLHSSLQLLDNASVFDTNSDEVVEISEADFAEFEKTTRRISKTNFQ